MASTVAFGAPRERKVLAAAVAVALAALAFLVWLLYVAVPAGGAPDWINAVPAVNAVCNAASALFAVGGVLAIRARRRALHQGLMLTALVWSALFLAGYVVFHRFHGETHYAGQGPLRVFYLLLLASHVLLSAVVLPLLLATVGFAGLGIFERHRHLARWTLPLWLYVSVSGVAVYFLLRSSY
jgi:putative membrane protein